MDFLHKGGNGKAIHGAHAHDIELSDQMLACELSGILCAAYPNYEWRVGVNSEGKVIDIFNDTISMTHGCRIIRPDLMAHDELRKKALSYGGEILERAAMKRGKFDGETLVEFVEGIEKAQDQPAVQRNIHKYRELLNARPASKH